MNAWLQSDGGNRIGATERLPRVPISRSLQRFGSRLRTEHLLAQEQAQQLQRQLEQSEELWHQYSAWPVTDYNADSMTAGIPSSR